MKDMETGVVIIQEQVCTKISVGGSDESTMEIDKVVVVNDEITSPNSVIPGEAEVTDCSGNKETKEAKHEIEEDNMITKEKASKILNDATLEKVTSNHQTATEEQKDILVDAASVKSGEDQSSDSAHEVKSVEVKDAATVENSVNETEAVKEISRNGENIVTEETATKGEALHDVETKEEGDNHELKHSEKISHEVEEDNTRETQEVQESLTVSETPTLHGEDIEREEHEDEFMREIPQDEIHVSKAEVVDNVILRSLETKSDEIVTEPSLVLTENIEQETVAEVQESNKVIMDLKVDEEQEKSEESPSDLVLKVDQVGGAQTIEPNESETEQTDGDKTKESPCPDEEKEKPSPSKTSNEKMEEISEEEGEAAHQEKKEETVQENRELGEEETKLEKEKNHKHEPASEELTENVKRSPETAERDVDDMEESLGSVQESVTVVAEPSEQETEQTDPNRGNETEESLVDKLVAQPYDVETTEVVVDAAEPGVDAKEEDKTAGAHDSASLKGDDHELKHSEQISHEVKEENIQETQEVQERLTVSETPTIHGEDNETEDSVREILEEEIHVPKAETVDTQSAIQRSFETKSDETVTEPAENKEQETVAEGIMELKVDKEEEKLEEAPLDQTIEQERGLEPDEPVTKHNEKMEEISEEESYGEETKEETVEANRELVGEKEISCLQGVSEVDKHEPANEMLTESVQTSLVTAERDQDNVHESSGSVQESVTVVTEPNEQEIEQTDPNKGNETEETTEVVLVAAEPSVDAKEEDKTADHELKHSKQISHEVEEDSIQETKEVQESLTVSETPTIQEEDTEVEDSLREIPDDERHVPKVEIVDTESAIQRSFETKSNETVTEPAENKEQQETVAEVIMELKVDEEIEKLEETRLDKTIEQERGLEPNESVTKHKEEIEVIWEEESYGAETKEETVAANRELVGEKEKSCLEGESEVDKLEEEKHKHEPENEVLTESVQTSHLETAERDQDNVQECSGSVQESVKVVTETNESKTEQTDQNRGYEIEESLVDKLVAHPDEQMETPYQVSEETIKALDEKKEQKEEAAHEEGEDGDSYGPEAKDERVSVTENREFKERSLDVTPLEGKYDEVLQVLPSEEEDVESVVDVKKMEEIKQTSVESLSSVSVGEDVESKAKEDAEIDEEKAASGKEDEHNAMVSEEAMSMNIVKELNEGKEMLSVMETPRIQDDNFIEPKASKDMEENEEKEEAAILKSLETSKESLGLKEEETVISCDEVRPSDKAQETVDFKSKETVQDEENLVDVPFQDIPSDLVELTDNKAEDSTQVKEEPNELLTRAVEMMPIEKMEVTTLPQEEEPSNVSHGGIIVELEKVQETKGNELADKTEEITEPHSSLPSGETVSEKIQDEIVKEEEEPIAQITKSHEGQGETATVLEDQTRDIGSSLKQSDSEIVTAEAKREEETTLSESEAVCSPMTGEEESQVTSHERQGGEAFVEVKPKEEHEEKTQRPSIESPSELSEETVGEKMEEQVTHDEGAETVSVPESSDFGVQAKEGDSCRPNGQEKEQREKHGSTSEQVNNVEEKSTEGETLVQDEKILTSLETVAEADKLEEGKVKETEPKSDNGLKISETKDMTSGVECSELLADSEEPNPKHVKEILEGVEVEVDEPKALEVPYVVVERESHERPEELSKAVETEETTVVPESIEKEETKTKDPEEHKNESETPVAEEDVCIKQQDIENLKAPKQEELSEDNGPENSKTMEATTAKTLAVETLEAYQTKEDEDESLPLSKGTGEAEHGDESSSALPVVQILQQLQNTLETERAIKSDETMIIETAEEKRDFHSFKKETAILENYVVTDISEQTDVEEAPPSEIAKENKLLHEESGEILEKEMDLKEEAKVQDSLSRELEVNVETMKTAELNEDAKASSPREEHPRDLEISTNKETVRDDQVLDIKEQKKNEEAQDEKLEDKEDSINEVEKQVLEPLSEAQIERKVESQVTLDDTRSINEIKHFPREEIPKDEGEEETVDALSEKLQVKQENESNDLTHLRQEEVCEDEIRNDGNDSIVAQKRESELAEEKREVVYVKTEPEDAVQHGVSTQEKNNMSIQEGTKEMYQEENTETDIKEEEEKTRQELLNTMKSDDDDDDVTEKTKPEIENMSSLDIAKRDEVPNEERKLEDLNITEEMQQKESDPAVKEPARKPLSDLIQNKSEDTMTHIDQEAKTDEDDEDGDEPKDDKGSTDSMVIVEARDTVSIVKTQHKKSHGILSGVGSKVKHSISKVKKAFTGKSSHTTTKPSSPPN